jgi:hypothetical protein
MNCRVYEPYTVMCYITKKGVCKFPILTCNIFSRRVLKETQKNAKSGKGKKVMLSLYLIDKAVKHYAMKMYGGVEVYLHYSLPRR